MINNRSFLEAFESVARLGTTHAAAIELAITQTGVTQRIKALEKELEVTLFLRSRRGMTLTEEGKILLQHQAAAQELEAQLYAKLKGTGRTETSITIVGPTSAISSRIAMNCTALYTRFPFLRLHLRTKDLDSRIEMLKRGLADIAIVAPTMVPNEMESKKLKPERYLLVGSPSLKHRRLTDILTTERIIDFSSTDRTTTNYIRHFGFDHVTTRERLYVNETSALLHYFSSGIGIGALTEAVARPYLDQGRIIALNRGHALLEPLALIWYPRPNRPDYFREIIKSIH
jgi:LysR family transcriptional regulator (chromosome initiation inhibitor)